MLTDFQSQASLDIPDFGWRDYWRMARARGVRLPIRYFMEAHWFDLRHGTDTHSWIPMSGYMVSWSSEIKRSLSWIQHQQGIDLDRFQFLDPGCGKGKPSFVYAMIKDISPRYPALGIDYCANLVTIAKNNQKILGNSLRHPVRFVHDDARSFPGIIESNDLIVFLYNPLEGEALSGFIDRISNYNAVLIYNYPVYLDLYLQRGFRVIHHWHGFHPNSTTSILSNIP